MPYRVTRRDLAPAVTTSPPADPSLPRVAVIGAGSSGLAAVKTLHLAGIPVDCFELFDKLEDPGASMSFSGVLLQPEQIAERALRILARPRAVTAVPAWRGVQARVFDLAPGLTARMARRSCASAASSSG